MPPSHRILLISHALGGGVEEHVSDLRLLLSCHAEVEILRPAVGQIVTLQTSDGSVLTWRRDDWLKLSKLLGLRNYQRVHFHHIHGFSAEILGLPGVLKVPYDVTLHDYLTYCPQYQLGTPSGAHCGEPDESECEKCLEIRPHPWGGTIQSWRATMAQFLERASRVIAPTAFVAERTKNHFPRIHIDVRQHPPRANWLAPRANLVKVVMVGALSRIKGLETLVACAIEARRSGTPLSFSLIGFPEHAIDPDLPVQIRGQYDDKNLPQLLALERADVAWFPGNFPETHSYTLDVALASGLPIVATAHGAFAERLELVPKAILVPVTALPSEWNRALLTAAGKTGVTVPGRRQDDGTVSDLLVASRLAYADYLLEPLAGLPAAPMVSDAGLASNLTTTAPPQTDLSLTALFEHGVLCGKTEPRRALGNRLVEIERDYAVMEAYKVRYGRPWYVLLGELDQLQSAVTNLKRMTMVAESRQQDVKRAMDQIWVIEHSTSWRITAPLRALGSVVKLLRLKTIRLVGAARMGSHKLPMVFQILRTQGLLSLTRRINDKLRGQVYRPPEVAHTHVFPIAPLLLQSAPAGQAPKVSLVIPVYGQHLHTFNCLRSLCQHTDLSDVEIIVVDDASPEPVAVALKDVEGALLVRNDENRGFIGSCARGADLARGEFLVLLNNDIQVTPGWLESLLDVFRLRADAGLVGARLVYPDGRLQEAGGIVWRDGSAWNWGRNEDPEHPMYRYLRAVDYCSGACLVLKRSDWGLWGGFDRVYAPAYYEDTDLAFRVRDAGKRVYYQPEAKIIHFEGVTSGTDVSRGVKKHQVTNREVFRNRWSRTLQSHRENGVEPASEADRQARSHVLIVEACMITPDQDSGSVRMLAMLELLLELGHRVSFVADNLEYRQPYVRMLQQAGVEVWHSPYIISVAQLLEERGAHFDFVLFCRHYIATPYMAKIREWAPKARIVFDTVDLHYLREQRKAELESSSSQLGMSLRTRRQELAVIRQSDITLVVSPVERDLLAKDAPGSVVRIVSNIHEIRRANTAYAEREGLIFIGGFRHPPNIDAVEWFVDQVWPLVRLQLPQMTLTVVGSHMPESVRALAGNGILTVGYVEDIAPVIDAARVSIAPLRYGAGVKGKINQAMACGLPVVATSVAVEGMNLVAGEEILIADQPQEYADEIVRLYGDANLWHRISDRGYENVQTHFSREAAKKALAELFEV